MPDPNDTNPVTPIHVEEKEEKRNTRRISGLFHGYKAMMAWVSLPIMGWGISLVWNTALEYRQQIVDVKARIKELETTNSQWTALADHENRIRQIEPQMGIVMWLLEHGKIKEVEKVTDTPLRIPRLEAVNVESFKKFHDDKARVDTMQMQIKK